MSSPFPGTVSKRTDTLPEENFGEHSVLMNDDRRRRRLHPPWNVGACANVHSMQWEFPRLHPPARYRDVSPYELIPVCAQIGLFICWPAPRVLIPVSRADGTSNGLRMTATFDWRTKEY